MYCHNILLSFFDMNMYQSTEKKFLMLRDKFSGNIVTF